MLILFLLCSVAAHSATRSDNLNEQWIQFKKDFNKSYANDSEENIRRSIWTESVHRVAKHNREADSGEHTYWLKINHFSDWTYDEFKHNMLGLDVKAKTPSKDIEVDGDLIKNYEKKKKETDKKKETWKRKKTNKKKKKKKKIAKKQRKQKKKIDKKKKRTDKKKRKRKRKKKKRKKKKKSKENIDWRKKGYVTPVKNQGKCNSCYAFAATGALEGQHFKKTGKLVSLSEQNIIDCSFDPPNGNDGCKQGYIITSYEYVITNNGVDSEESYPYVGKVQKCRFNPSVVGSHAQNIFAVPPGSEKALRKAVKKHGPISAVITICCGGTSFKEYGRGIFTEQTCNATCTKFRHAVLVVGYGYEEYEQYWLVKNSWGGNWGMAGYVMIAKDKNNTCGIANEALYPEV